MRVLFARIFTCRIKLSWFLSNCSIVLKHRIGVCGTCGHAFLIKASAQIHNALEVTNTIYFGHLCRTQAFAKLWNSIKCLATSTINAASLALIFLWSIAGFARIMTALTIFLTLPLAILHVISEFRAKSFRATVFKQFVPCHAFEALCWPFSTALGAPNARTADCLHKELRGIIIVSNVDSSLAIHRFVGTMCHKDEVLLDVSWPNQKKLHGIRVDIVRWTRIFKVHCLYI